MRFINLFMIFTSYLFILTSTCKPLAISATTSKIKESVVQHLMANANLTNVDENEDSKQILSEAINDYKKDLTKYINITALNVLDKEDVKLPYLRFLQDLQLLHHVPILLDV